MGGNYKVPILTLHEGRSHGRDIVEIPSAIVDRHYRVVKLRNDIDEVILTHHKGPVDGASHSSSTTKRSTLVEENEECIGSEQ
uniref:Uncharacterized protein n=1 Tax=Angiostrongylus cantonensis TaxID=6313 RepID=A0A0K0DQ82_ANGCA